MNSNSPLPDHSIRQNTNATRWIAAFLIVTSITIPLTACDVCFQLPRNPFDVDHPAAIEVAVATREAADLGHLELNPVLKQAELSDSLLPPRLDTISPRQLVRLWLKTRPAHTHQSMRFTLELVFVDLDRVCRLDIRFGSILDDVPMDDPADVRLFTTKAGFLHLLEEGFEHSEQRRLVIVEAEHESNSRSIAKIFAATSRQTDQQISSLW